MGNHQSDRCRTVSWIVAVVAGILGYALARGGFDWGVFAALVVAIAVFFVAGYLLVRLLCRAENTALSQPAVPSPEAAPAPRPVTTPTPAPAPEPAAPAPQSTAQEPGDGAPDDLKKIKGIGPGLEKSLNAMGVFRFAQIAGWSRDDVRHFDENMARFKGRATRDNWVEQAKLLAGGDATEFSSRVEDGEVY